MQRIENWCLIVGPFEGCIFGDIYNRPGVPDGMDIRTSRVVKADKETGMITTKSGSIYKLGHPSADYEKKFPNARERLFNAENPNEPGTVKIST